MARTKITCRQATGGKSDPVVLSLMPSLTSTSRAGRAPRKPQETGLPSQSAQDASSGVEKGPSYPTRESPHRVLCILELLDDVFRRLDPGSLSSCARVCKWWHDVALDVLWEQVDDLRPLFKILPMYDGILHFSDWLLVRQPGLYEWNTFDKYAQRIRQFNCLGFPGCESAITEALSIRGQQSPFPNLRILYWDAPLGLCPYFLTDKLEEFTVYLESESDALCLCKKIPSSAPGILKLDFRSLLPNSAVEDGLAKMLQQMLSLRELMLPPTYFSEKIAEAVSHLLRLEVVDFSDSADRDLLPISEDIRFLPSLTEGSFPALEKLATSANFDDVAKFFHGTHAPPNLLSLCLDSSDAEKPDSVYRLLLAIRTSAPDLEELTLISTHMYGAHHSITAWDSVPTSLKFGHLQPLLTFHKLSHLEVVHPYPLSLTDEEIDLLASSWPMMDTLSLCPEPTYMLQSRLTEACLISFATKCPALSHLSLFVDIHRNGCNQRAALLPLPRFRSLESLCVGYSIICGSCTEYASAFLHNILPPDCDVFPGSPFSATVDTDETGFADLLERLDLWRQVSLPFSSSPD